MAHPSKGYCSDYKYLPEGGYPARLDSNANPLEECAQRCIAAAEENSEYSKDAFYVRDSDKHCACSKGECSETTSGDYTSYIITPTAGVLLPIMGPLLHIWCGAVC